MARELQLGLPGAARDHRAAQGARTALGHRPAGGQVIGEGVVDQRRPGGSRRRTWPGRTANSRCGALPDRRSARARRRCAPAGRSAWRSGRRTAAVPAAARSARPCAATGSRARAGAVVTASGSMPRSTVGEERRVVEGVTDQPRQGVEERPLALGRVAHLLAVVVGRTRLRHGLAPSAVVRSPLHARPVIIVTPPRQWPRA